MDYTSRECRKYYTRDLWQVAYLSMHGHTIKAIEITPRNGQATIFFDDDAIYTVARTAAEFRNADSLMLDMVPFRAAYRKVMIAVNEARRQPASEKSEVR